MMKHKKIDEALLREACLKNRIKVEPVRGPKDAAVLLVTGDDGKAYRVDGKLAVTPAEVHVEEAVQRITPAQAKLVRVQSVEKQASPLYRKLAATKREMEALEQTVLLENAVKDLQVEEAGSAKPNGVVALLRRRRHLRPERTAVISAERRAKSVKD